MGKRAGDAYSEAVGKLTQSGTDAPTVVWSVNEIGTMVLAYSAVGIYTLILTGAFVAANTFARVEVGGDDTNKAEVVITDDDTLTINCFTGGSAADDLLTDTPIHIRVYN